MFYGVCASFKSHILVGCALEVSKFGNAGVDYNQTRFILFGMPRIYTEDAIGRFNFFIITLGNDIN